MNNRGRISIIAIKFSLLVSVIILIVTVIMARFVINQTRQSLINEMRLRAEYFARVAKESLFPQPDLFQLHFAVNELAKEKAIRYAIVVDTNSKIVSHIDSKLIGELDKTSIGQQSYQSEQVLTQTYNISNENFVDISIPLIVGTLRIGTARLGFSDESITAALSEMRKKIIIITIIVLAASLVFTIFMVVMMVRPINKLARIAQAVGRGDLEQTINIKRRDEIGYLAKAFNDMILGLKERDFIRKTFGKYVSKQVAEAVLTNKIKLGGERRRVTVLVCDIRGFTTMSEQLRPEDVVHLLNEYFSIMVDIISENNGTVDKFIGDAIFAVFGAPWAYPMDHFRALKSAWTMKIKMAEFNNQLISERRAPLKIGIALHSGVVVAGNIGSDKRMEYTCIGDTVNTCHRIEGLNSEWGTELLISDKTLDLVRDYVQVKQMPSIRLKGKANETQTYELLNVNLPSIDDILTQQGGLNVR
ncbi:MAG: adenylate/guanylate cyclase domain-containing protein [Elusimicrobiota bacterium]